MNDPENISRLPGVTGELVPNPRRQKPPTVGVQPGQGLSPRCSCKGRRVFAAALLLFALIVFAMDRRG